MFNLKEEGVVTIQALKAADNESLTGTGVDMLGYKSVLFVAGSLKGEALNFTMKAQQASASNFSSAADLEDSKVEFSTTESADALAMLDVRQPKERYVRPVVAVPDAAAATPTFCIAIRYNAKYKPVTQSAEAELHVTPDEGTA